MIAELRGWRLTLLAGALALGILLAGIAISDDRAGASVVAAGASPEAKQACAKLKRKAQRLEGKKRRAAMKRYKSCLQNHESSDDDSTSGDQDGVLDNSGAQQGDAKEAARQLIENQEFYRVFATQYTSGEDLVRFCSGTWWRRYTSQGQYTASDTFGSGTWTMTNATQGTYEGYTVYEATLSAEGTYDNQPLQGNIIVDVSPETTRSYINLGEGLKEYIRRDLTGSC